MTIDTWLLGRGELPPHEPRMRLRGAAQGLTVTVDVGRRWERWLEREGLNQASALRVALTELLDREEPA